MTEENKFLITGVVANGFEIEQRKKLSKDFEKIKVDSDLIIVSGAKIPFTMVKPIYVVEIESTDIINSSSDGYIKKDTINFKEKYSFDKKTNSVSLTTPVYTRFRDDKKVSLIDVGINQITRVIEILDEESKNSVKPKSKIINKEVYTKTMKGATNVKKFLVWDTASNDENYPKFVYYKIDYSPTRASKLNRDIKVSDNKKQIQKIFANEIESNIKKGWNKI
jgi:hypothetical protein